MEILVYERGVQSLAALYWYDRQHKHFNSFPDKLYRKESCKKSELHIKGQSVFGNLLPQLMNSAYVSTHDL